MLCAMFDRTFSALYWLAALAGGGWLAWLCFANLHWLAAVLLYPVLLALAAAVAAPVLAAGSAVVAGAAALMVAVIRRARRSAA